MELEAILQLKQLRYIAQAETRIWRKTQTRASDYNARGKTESEGAVATRSVFAVWSCRTSQWLAVDSTVSSTQSN